MSQIDHTIEALKTAYKLTDELEIEGTDKIIKLQKTLLAAEESAIAAKEEIARLETWERERGDYLLQEISAGIFAYTTVKPDNEPHPFLCADCFNLGKKSILQLHSRTKSGFKNLICHGCGAIVEIHH
jgi:hypothetical protein